jgi:hypothetical protein
MVVQLHQALAWRRPMPACWAQVGCRMPLESRLVRQLVRQQVRQTVPLA